MIHVRYNGHDGDNHIGTLCTVRDTTMITFKEIIALVKNHGLKNARFIPHDSSLALLKAVNGELFFEHSDQDDAIADMPQEEIDRIDEENTYFTEEVWDEIQNEDTSAHEQAVKIEIEAIKTKLKEIYPTMTGLFMDVSEAVMTFSDGGPMVIREFQSLSYTHLLMKRFEDLCS